MTTLVLSGTILRMPAATSGCATQFVVAPHWDSSDHELASTVLHSWDCVVALLGQATTHLFVLCLVACDCPSLGFKRPQGYKDWNCTMQLPHWRSCLFLLLLWLWFAGLPPPAFHVEFWRWVARFQCIICPWQLKPSMAA